MNELAEVVMTIMEGIRTEIENGDMTLNDETFRTFLPVIYAEGNLLFLQTIAKELYDDSRSDVIVNFLDLVLEWTEEARNANGIKTGVIYGSS